MKRRSPAPPGKPSAMAAGQSLTVTIEAMGAQGHGMAHAGGVKVFIAFTLPGEQVRIALNGGHASVVEIEKPSPDRVEPLCKHSGICGGCALQHWKEARYLEWKESLLTSALARAGIDARAGTLTTYPLASRRRAAFAARKAGRDVELGYNIERTHTIIGLEECPVLLPQIASALPVLKDALAGVMPAKAEAKIYVAAAANGLDCAIQGPRLSAAAHAALARALGAAGFIRAAWNGEPVLMTAAPFVLCGGVEVALPPKSFLQAVEACERDMADWVVEALTEARAFRGPVCDLFAGLGAFSFPAARFSPVAAYEENADAASALAGAAKRATALKPVAAIRRDLYRNPLGPLELNKFAAVIMDPPREGAEAQARALAASKIPAIAMLSCNPATFARDAATLAGGGYKLARLAIFDQFRFSAHMEIAALFLRAGAKKGRT